MVGGRSKTGRVRFPLLLLALVLVGVPLGVWAAESPRVASGIRVAS
jgi:ABC-type proline/glycine betaine transport system permease subunit